MTEEVIGNLLSNVGVPAAICFYTLFKLNSTFEKLTEAINKQTQEIEHRETENASEISILKDHITAMTCKIDIVVSYITRARREE